MNKFELPILFLLPILIPSCSWKGTNTKDVFCENYFNMTNDFKNWFPDQEDYRNFISQSYYETFINDKKCHYYIKYKDGTEVDTWGIYTMTTSQFNMVFDNGMNKTPSFVLYASPTIDFHIIDTLDYNGKTYSIVYQARYLYSAKG